MNEWSLKWGFTMLNRTESVGIDRISLKAYEETVNRNVEDLLERMKKMSYQKKRRGWYVLGAMPLRIGSGIGVIVRETITIGKSQGRSVFLGFTHYCTCTPKGRFKIGRKTEKKRFNGSLKRAKAWLKKTRNQHKLKVIWEKISQKLIGHYRYFGVSGNYRSLGMFYFRIVRLLFKWLNRRSQKKSYNWEEFNKYLKTHALPRPKIFCNLC